MQNSMMIIVFAKNYLKHSKVNGMCVKSTPVLAPLTSPFRSFEGLFFFFRSKWASKIEEKCVPLESQRILGCKPNQYFRTQECYIADLLFHKDHFCIIKFLAILPSWRSKPEKAVRISAFQHLQREKPQNIERSSVSDVKKSSETLFLHLKHYSFQYFETLLSIF